MSPPFALGHGVRQGSILSPALFLLIMDSLLQQLQSLSIGVSVNNMYVGGFIHANDIRILASTTSTLEVQISTVKRFTEGNFLKVNSSKCEIVALKKAFTRINEERIEVGECTFSLGGGGGGGGGSATYVRYQRKDDLSFSRAIQICVQKDRKAYFQYGSIYAFQGKVLTVLVIFYAIYIYFNSCAYSLYFIL